MNTVRILYTVGNALLTIGSVVALARRAQYFGQRVRYHHGKGQHQPKNYTKRQA